MSQIRKNVSNFEAVNCEKYLNRLIRQEKQLASKKPSSNAKVLDRQAATPRQFVINGSPPPKSRPLVQQSHSPVRNKPAPSPQIAASGDDQARATARDPKRRQRSSSSSISDREPWGKLLMTTRSREKMSSFDNFDPLRTLHFLSKELQFRLHNTLPDDNEIHQMVSDMQLALKRIPPEVSSIIHIQQAAEIAPLCRRSSGTSHDENEKLIITKTSTDDKICQTPPTLNQDDTAKLKRIMEESTEKLEKSCKQLERLCLNLQNENEALENQLREEKDRNRLLGQRIKDVENEIDTLTTGKIKKLELENQNLQLELARNISNYNQSALSSLQQHPELTKLVEELDKQKKESDKKCAKLQYELTLLGMEKEKFVTMLGIRDKELKQVHDEMNRVQEEVARQLSKLNGESISKTSSNKSLTAIDNHLGSINLLDLDKECVGDATISSIATNHESPPTRKGDKLERNVFKELPSGDGSTIQDLTRPKVVEFQGEKVVARDADAEFEIWLGEMTRFCSGAKNSNNNNTETGGI